MIPPGRDWAGLMKVKTSLPPPIMMKAQAPEKGQENKTLRTAALDNEKIDKIINEHQGKPGSLIHVLMEIQSENHWLPKEVLNKVSEKLKVPLSRVMQIASFYKTFSLTPKGRHEVHVCTGTSCHVRGASHLLATLQDLIGIRPGETDAERNVQPGRRQLPRLLYPGAGDNRRWETSRQVNTRQGGRCIEKLC